ncbi:flocculation protein FLO11-like [Aplysia californica]|uniref:Flocculation protein FLO11-like n=1 Tax=Aplysia californica TaxID=6500 RepID=A0ABM1ABZ5_APLCA|nr:flocculation protein FLO11-like [Aplysia californica]
METSGALKLLQKLLEAEEDNEDVTENDCEEYNNAVSSVPSSLDPKTIIASLISRANSVLSNGESEHADSSMSDDDGDDPDYVPTTNTSLLTENDSFTVTENGSPSVKTNQNALVTRSPASRPSRSQDTDTSDTTGPAPRPGRSQDNDTTGPAPRPGTSQDNDTTDPAPRPGTSQDNDTTGPAPRPGTSQDNDTIGPAPRPGTSQDNDTTGPASRPGTNQDNDTTGPAPRPGTNQDNDTTGPAQTNPKKRQRNPYQWKKNVRKSKIAKGEAYTTKTGKAMPARKTGQNCKCRLKCFQRIGEDHQDKILQSFNDIGNKQWQEIYLHGCIDMHAPKRKRSRNGERENGKDSKCFTCEYSVTPNGVKLQVCMASIHSPPWHWQDSSEKDKKANNYGSPQGHAWPS